jgi:predicted amidohydrolase
LQEELRLAALEVPARFDRVGENLALVDSLLARTDADLVLLPEASLTGYVSPRGDFDLARFAEPKDGETARALSALAKKHHTRLVGPLIEHAGEYVYNAMIGFDAEGRELLHYRKRHPWYPETWATPGDLGHPIVDVAGARVTIAVCFDVHFGEIPPADVLLFASAWVEPDEPGESREALLAKLRTNVVNANWGLGEPRVRGQGGSCILHASGDVTRIVRGAEIVSGIVRPSSHRPC